MGSIGQPLTRVDGKSKVTGAAKYSAEFAIPNLSYAVIVQSTIPNGRMIGMDTGAAEGADGVLAVLTPANAPKLTAPQSRLSLLQSDQVFYNRQPIAVVVAETLHQAQHAASLVHVLYQPAPPRLDFEAGFPVSYPGSHAGEPGDVSWGDVEKGLREAEVKLDQIYTTPIQHHNPMEPHATIAQWDGNHLTVHDTSQYIYGVKRSLAKMFGLPEENVQVISLFLGGGFGCKGPMWSHVPLAVMAASKVNRPVKLVLERPQMFGPVGARPRTHQRLTVGATREGKLTAIRHEVHANTSVIEDYLESSAFPTRVMYACQNVATIHRIVALNLGTPTYMRAPGVATGTYALEVAMDELAYELKVDPLELRLRNYAEADPHTGEPFSEKSLRDCYLRGAERFGWSKRLFEPGSMRDASQLLGWGMATETYPANREPASAFVRLQTNGRGLVASATHDLGTGMYTIMTQVAADALGMSPDRIDAHLGDTTYPEAPISAGSFSTASVMPAIQAAAEEARLQLLRMAAGDAKSPVHGAAIDDLDFKDGFIFQKSFPNRSENYMALLARNGGSPIEATQHVEFKEGDRQSMHSFGAIFAEVGVDPQLGVVRVRRVVAVYDVGRLLNEKTAKSQFIGGIIWGISLALREDTHVDTKNGRIVNANLADYLVPVNADIGEIDVSATGIPDTTVDPLGARGIGEIGITGTGAAIANAVYHATGKRVRDLPITPDKLL